MTPWLDRTREAIGRIIATHATPLSAEAIVRLGVRRPSQCGQDRWVIETLGGLRGGYFADVGASNGVVSNNTLALERDFGWRGVCIEANSLFLKTLRRHRLATCVDAVVWDTDDAEVDFLASGVCGGVVAADMDNVPGAASEATTPRRTRSLASILHDVGAPPVIDYLSLDVEGAENRVLAGFPFHEFAVRLMTIERPPPALESRLADLGFRVVRRIVSNEGLPVDSFFAHDSVAPAIARSGR